VFQKTATPINHKVNDKWYNIGRFYGRENPRKSGNGIFGCIPHGCGALSGSGGVGELRVAEFFF
jgi:hypothetical protein